MWVMPPYLKGGITHSSDRTSHSLGAEAVTLAWMTTLVIVVPYLAFGSMTAVGEFRRVGRLPAAVAAGILFPFFWIAWYVRDRPRKGR